MTERVKMNIEEAIQRLFDENRELRQRNLELEDQQHSIRLAVKSTIAFLVNKKVIDRSEWNSAVIDGKEFHDEDANVEDRMRRIIAAMNEILDLRIEDGKPTFSVIEGGKPD